MRAREGAAPGFATGRWGPDKRPLGMPIKEAAHMHGSRVRSGALGSPRSARVGFGA